MKPKSFTLLVFPAGSRVRLLMLPRYLWEHIYIVSCLNKINNKLLSPLDLGKGSIVCHTPFLTCLPCDVYIFIFFKKRTFYKEYFKETRMNPDSQLLFHPLNITLDFLHKSTSGLLNSVHLGASLKSNISHAKTGNKIGTKVYVKQIPWSLRFKREKASKEETEEKILVVLSFT